MSDHLPEGVLVDIFLKLPVKTLICCTSVCKSWYSLITSSDFISTHLNCSKNNRKLLVRYCGGLSYGREKENYTVFDDNEALDMCSTIDFPFNSQNHFFRIIGSCNGLICLSDDYVSYTDKIIVWNPSVKKVVYLPEINVTRDYVGAFKRSIGFGFDGTTNDYKVVRVTHLECIGICPKVEVYRLNTGNWEDISQVALPYFITERSVGPYVNGFVHWIGWDEGQKHMLVVFDMGSEMFREMMLPYSLANNVSLWGDVLFDCHGLLCLVHNFPDDIGNRKFDIWVMESYGEAESWTKRFTVDYNGLRRPLGFRNTGEMLWASKRGYLVSYDPQNKDIKDIGIRGSEKFLSRFSFYVGTYTESLVLLDRRGNI